MSLTKVSYSMIQGSPYNILDFGAVCDGVTDDTDAINTALAYMKANNGGTLIFPGICLCADRLDQVTGAYGITLQGVSSTYANATQKSGLLFTGTGTSGQAFLDLSSCDNIRIINMDIRYSNSGFLGKLVSLEQTARSTVADCNFGSTEVGVESAATIISLVGTIGTLISRTNCTRANYLISGGSGSNGNTIQECNFDSYVTAAIYNPEQSWVIIGGFCEPSTTNKGGFIFCENATVTRGLTVQGVWMGDASDNSAWVWMRFGIVNGLNISGCYINGTGFLTAQAIYIYGASSGVNIQSNYIASFDKAVNLNGAADKVNIGPNTIASVNYEVFNAPDVTTASVGYYDSGTTRVALGGQAYLSSTQTVSSATTYSVDNSKTNVFVFLVTAASTNFTIATPSSAVTQQTISIKVVNSSGGSLGTITWGADYRLSSWTNPATNYSRTIDFAFNGAAWVEKSRTPADVPN